VIEQVLQQLEFPRRQIERRAPALGPALAQVLAGAPVAKPESKTFGCTIKRKP